MITIDQVLIPAAIFEDGQLKDTNRAFDRLLAPQSKERATLVSSSEIEQHIDRAISKKRAVSFEIGINKQTLRCQISPVTDQPAQSLLFVEDISAETQSDLINALLYRLSLLLSTTNETLAQKLQSAVDQILFEIPLFDCSIMLFSKLDGRLHPVAWGTSDTRSSISGKRSFALNEGIAGRAAVTQRPILIPNTLHDSRYAHKPNDKTELALVSLPIVVGDDTLGVLSITRPVDPGFSDKDLQLFMTIISRLGLVIMTYMTNATEKKQTQLTQVINASRGILEDYRLIAPLFGELMSADQCYILHWDQSTGRISLMRHEAEKKFPAAERAKIESYLRQIKNRHLAMTTSWITLGKATLFPLIVRKQLAGFVYIKNTYWNRTLNERELQLGSNFSDQLAIALENAAYNDEAMNERKKLQQIQDALHDGLLLYTTDMKVAMVNTAARRLLGIKQDITGLAWEKVLHKDMKKYCSYELVRHFDPAEFLRLAIKEGRTSSGEATLMTQPPKTVAITVAPVYDRRNELSGVLSHIRDITQVHDLQQKMALRVEELTNLFKISSVTGFDSKQIIRRILRLVLPLLSVRGAELILCDETTGQLVSSETAGDLVIDESIRKRINQKTRAAIKDGSPKALKFNKQMPAEATHALIVPISSERNVCLGAIVAVDRKDHRYFSREDINLLSIVATQLATKLDNAWLMQQVGTDRDKLATVIDQSIDGVLVVDNDQVIQIWNRALEKMTGVPEKMVQNKPIDFASTLTERLEMREIGSTIEVLIRHRITKKPVWLSLDYAPITHKDEVIGQIAIIRDVSRQKELDRAQNEFVATASHELRSPITAIVGYLSMLRRGDAGQITNKEQALFVDKAYSNSKRMVGLIEDLLMTTRMEAGQIRYEQKPIVLSELIETVLSDISFKALDKGIALHCQRKNCGTVLADHDGLQQVLTNLVNNAINYTEPGGSVTISFRQTNEKGKPHQVIKIKDTGVGIDQHDQDKIFDKFSRIDNVLSISAGGTGLGLYITKSIVEELNGKIWVKSKKGHGATFYVSLPRADSPVKKGKE
jgi:PAS domain S-box-containing protein